jgi:glycosyltransferase involved in cell wall biosynthesis
MVKFSVAIPAHNSEHCLRETLESVLAQTYAAHEIIVVDDGSSDSTAEIVQSFGNKVRYIRQEKSGASAARNNAIDHATGDWIAFLDHDDLFHPEKLEKQRAVVEADPKLVVVYSTFTYLYPDGSTKESPAYPAQDLWPGLRYRTPILPSTSVVKRSALVEVGAFRLGPLVRRVEDWDLWFRLIRRYSVSAFYGLDESLLLYRVLPNSESKGFMPMAANALVLLDTILLEDVSGVSKSIWRRKIEARFYYHLALSLRDSGNPRFWEYALESLIQWPFFGDVLPVHRYRVFAHMLYMRLKNFRFNFRYWWPVRACREGLRD